MNEKLPVTVPTAVEKMILRRDVQDLCEMLTYKRPAWTDCEIGFVARYLGALGATADGYGNQWYRVPGNSRLMFSCHTDTVHMKGGLQKIYYNKVTGDVFSDSDDCLGADCTAGVWLMLEMIKAKVPGVYVFHRAEERGGLGSGHVAQKEKELLKGIDFAIAFDRKGQSEVITHQMQERTCSNAFANSLCGILPGLSLKPSDGGVFTDTAFYAETVAECSNVSVGYEHAHSANEFLSIAYILRLRDALVKADWTKLIKERNPAASLPPKKSTGRYGEWGQGTGGYRGRTTYSGYGALDQSLTTYCYNNPSLVAQFLEECGYNVDDLRKFAREYTYSNGV